MEQKLDRSNAPDITVTPGPIPLRKWTKDREMDSSTVWRMRRKGWLTTINICGRPYLTQAAIAEFERRAVSGEFAQPASGAAKPKVGR